MNSDAKPKDKTEATLASNHDHSHALQINRGNETRVLWAIVITGMFLLLEVVGGILAGSLVLLADAGHMLVDLLALVLAWIGFRIARRPADPQRSFGYHRFPVLAAFVNGMSLFFISAGILYEAVGRLVDPPEQILSGMMLWVAIAGMIANIVSLFILSSSGEDNINLKSAALHVLGDLLGSVAAIAAAIVIMFTEWTPIDPILSVVVCFLILGSAWKIVRKSGHILMQGTPASLDTERIRSELIESIDEIFEVHHIHVWELTEGKPVVSLHARVHNQINTDAALGRIKQELHDRFDLHHSVVQIESPTFACPPEAEEH